jgi:hypothetical protein
VLLGAAVRAAPGLILVQAVDLSLFSLPLPGHQDRVPEQFSQLACFAQCYLCLESGCMASEKEGMV